MKFDPGRYSRLLARLFTVVALVFSGFALPAPRNVQAFSNALPGPSGSGKFGASLYSLPNGNFVVIDPEFSPGSQVKIGAVYLFDGTTHDLISRITGTTDEDRVGSGGIKLLKDDNFVVFSPRWNNGGVSMAGAVTWCSATTGCPAAVTAANSLVGSHPDDEVGTNWTVDPASLTDSGTITPLPGGAYLVQSARWDNYKGALTFCANGSDPDCLGPVTSSNSLVGSTSQDYDADPAVVGDYIGQNVTVVPGGGYIVSSSYWSNGSAIGAGVVVPCPASGCRGVVSTTNSLYGTTTSDGVGSSITLLKNSDFVVESMSWGGGFSQDGAVTYCASVTDPACIGQPVSTGNSLTASIANSIVAGNGITVLPDGSYIVKSSSWRKTTELRTGAATLCTVSNGTSSCTGQFITSANSLTGDWDHDSVGSAVVLLADGALLVSSAQWHDWTGAVTFCSSIAACIGQQVSAANSAVGGNKGVSWNVSTGGDMAGGGGILALSGGGYVVFSPHWDPVGADTEKGAATFCPSTGCTGVVTLGSSLTGAKADDLVGMAGGLELASGAVIISSPFWANDTHTQAGAVTFCSTPGACQGSTVQLSNSLVGDQDGIQIGYYTNYALSNGAYLVGSYNWANGAETVAGALTWCPDTGCQGMTIDAANSLVGSHKDDYVGGGAADIGDGLYLTQTGGWQNGVLQGAGAVTLCRQSSGCTGPINSGNSLLGSVQGIDYYGYLYSYNTYEYDPIHHQLLVGLPLENRVVFFTLAPNAVTDPASSVTSSGARLNGTVNAMNDSTTVTFEYGLTTSYGASVAADQSPLSGSSGSAVSAAITGLNPGTQYHYRVVATNSTGPTHGSDRTFTTSALPPAATTNAASNISSSGATVNGLVNARGTSTTVTFEYGETASYGSTVTAEESPVAGAIDTSVSKVIAGLTPSTLYHYRVAAVNAGGTTNGLDRTFTTNPLGPTVSTDAATGITTAGATLNGTVNAINASTTVTFEYGETTGYGSIVTADQSPVTGSSDSPVSKTITGLTPNTQYHFRASGINTNGSTHGTDRTFTTAAAAPAASTGSANSITASGATLQGTVNAFNASSTVTFEYGVTTGYGTSVTADQSPVTGTSDTPVSFTLTALAPNTLYHFRMVAANSGGTTQGLDQTFTTGSVAPSATTGAASSVSPTGGMLNATVDAHNASSTVTFEYGLTTSYGSSVPADGSPVTGIGDTSVSKTISGLVPNTLYHYRVVAVNTAGTTHGMDQTFTTGALAPVVTTGDASSITKSGAMLNGSVNANNASTSVTFEFGLTTGYGTTVTAAESPVGGTSVTPVSKSITGLAPNTLYHFRVKGQNTAGSTDGLDQTFTTAPDVCQAVGNTVVNWSVAFAACPPGTKLVIPVGLTVIQDVDVSLNVDLEVLGAFDGTSLQKTFTLTGAGAQTLTGNPLAFYRLTVNKNTPGDTVTISGKLKVTKKLTITRGKLTSASDYADVEIGNEGALELTSDITVSGNFTNTGSFVPGSHAVTFDGGTDQNLTLGAPTEFYDLVVGSGTTLIETETLNQAAIGRNLTNLGTIRKTQPVAAAGQYTFGLAGQLNAADLMVDVTTLGSLVSIQVDRVDRNHPGKLDSEDIKVGSGPYWKIATSGSGYQADVSLPHGVTPSSNARACAYTGSGTIWTCKQDAVTPHTVTYHDASQSSEWAVGDRIDVNNANLTGYQVVIGWWHGLQLQWRSTTEIDTAGYNLYRSEQPDGPYGLVNQALIPAQTPGSTVGNSYTYEDSTAQSGTRYYYKLVRVSPISGENGNVLAEGIVYRIIMITVYK